MKMKLTGLQKLNICAREALMSEKERPENLGKMAQNRKTYCCAN